MHLLYPSFTCTDGVRSSSILPSCCDCELHSLATEFVDRITFSSVLSTRFHFRERWKNKELLGWNQTKHFIVALLNATIKTHSAEGAKRIGGDSVPGSETHSHPCSKAQVCESKWRGWADSCRTGCALFPSEVLLLAASLPSAPPWAISLHFQLLVFWLCFAAGTVWREEARWPYTYQISLNREQLVATFPSDQAAARGAQAWYHPISEGLRSAWTHLCRDNIVERSGAPIQGQFNVSTVFFTLFKRLHDEIIRTATDSSLRSANPGSYVTGNTTCWAQRDYPGLKCKCHHISNAYLFIFCIWPLFH